MSHYSHLLFLTLDTHDNTCFQFCIAAFQNRPRLFNVVTLANSTLSWVQQDMGMFSWNENAKVAIFPILQVSLMRFQKFFLFWNKRDYFERLESKIENKCCHKGFMLETRGVYCSKISERSKQFALFLCKTGVSF